MSLIIWSFISLVIVYIYVGFPLCLGLLAKLFKCKHNIDENHQPSVTLIISAYNEEAVIQEKLENSLKLDYPADKLQIFVVSDCSDDRTDEIVKNFNSKQVRLVRMDARNGKTAGLNKAMELIDSELVVFSDANAIYDLLAIKKLARHFADAKIGYVVGHAKYASATNSSAEESEGLYWNYEIQLKQWESDFHSVVGGDGALYMIRRELYQPLEKTDINDFVNPLQIIAAGYRGLFDSEAFCVEHASGSFEKEFGRKVRIVNRSFNGLLRVSELLNIFNYGRFTWLLVSHKLLRWFSPMVLLLHFVVTLTLPLSGPFTFLPYTFLGLYFALATLALIGCVAERKGNKALLPFYLSYYFILMNIASVYGVVKRLRGDKIVTWSTVRDDGSRRDIGLNAVYCLATIIIIVISARLLFASKVLDLQLFLEISIFSLFSLLIYTYVGYPALLFLLRPLFKKQHDIDEKYEPTVTLLIAAYNEEYVIADKIKNSFELDYPSSKLTILIVSDGSTDKTEEIARGYAQQGIQLIALSPNRGKVTALNEAFKQIETEIVVMSDANVMYQPDAIKKLVRNFADQNIGAVSGKVVLLNDELSYADAENKYYSIEHLIQALEGETGSMIGSDGAMYALRTELYPWPDADIILDDFVISMGIVKQGKRLTHDRDALGFERNDQEIENEFKRKVRIVAGGIQCLLRCNIFPPRKQFLTWFKLISHKVLRWFSGLIFVLLIGSLLLNCSLYSSHTWFHHAIIIVIAIFSFIALVAYFVPKVRRFKLFSLAYYLFLMHLASLVGIWKGLAGSQKVTWKKAN